MFPKQSTYIIFHTRGKKFNIQENAIVYNENEIGKPQKPELITPLERIHDLHPQKDSRVGWIKLYDLVGSGGMCTDGLKNKFVEI